MKLNIPLYKQTTDYTCGPSSVSMVLSYFNKKKPTREKEFELWPEIMSVPFKIASAYGIAGALAKRGLKVILFMKNNPTTKKEVQICFKYENIPKSSQNKHFQYYKFYKNVLRTNAKKAGVKFVNNLPSASLILKSLKKRYAVIAGIDDYQIRKMIGKKKLQHIAHAVVIKGLSKDRIIINDPWDGEVRFPIKDFSELVKTKKYFNFEPYLVAVRR